MTYHISTLPNGLRVATESLPGMESTTIAVTIDVGARFEHENEGGLSHLLEHMAFKGTKRRSAVQIAEEMDMIGGNMNAYTSLESTVYYTRVLKNDVTVAVDMLADILQHSTFAEDELVREREVILQEIAMYYDTPDELIADYFSETAYPNQAIGRSILGTSERVASFTQDDLTRYMSAHYHAPNMVVSAAGNIKHEHFVKVVGEHFSELSTATHPSATPAKYSGGDKRTKRKLEQLHLMMGFEGVAIHHQDYYAWQVLSTLLGGGMSSRLFQEVREKRGLAYTVQSFVSAFADSGVLGIYAATAENKASEMATVICDEGVKLQAGITDTELQRAKNQIKASLFMSRESTSSIAEWIGRHLVSFSRYKPASEIAALIDAVTADDITRIAKAFTANPKLTFTTLGPQKKLPEYDKLKERLTV